MEDPRKKPKVERKVMTPDEARIVFKMQMAKASDIAHHAEHAHHIAHAEHVLKEKKRVP